MFIGFFVRRFVTVLLCAGSFWLGIKTDAIFASGGTPAGSTPAETLCPEAQDGN